MSSSPPMADMTLMFDNSRSLSDAFTLVRAQQGDAVLFDCREGHDPSQAELRSIASLWLPKVAGPVASHSTWIPQLTACSRWLHVVKTQFRSHAKRHLLGESATHPSGPRYGPLAALLLLAGSSPPRRRALPAHRIAARSGAFNCGIQVQGVAEAFSAGERCSV